MNLFKKLTSLISIKEFILVCTVLFFTNNIIAKGSEDQSYLIYNENEFEKIYNLHSIPFSEYDNFENQLRTSLGFYSIEFEKSYFDDLSIINTSDDIRKIYKTKLNDMTINKNNYIIEK